MNLQEAKIFALKRGGEFSIAEGAVLRPERMPCRLPKLRWCR
jgi:hypothetical protein